MRHRRWNTRGVRWWLALVLGVIGATLAALFFGASASKAVPNPALVFMTNPQTLTAGTASGTITIERQDGSGNPITTGAATVELTSTSSRGDFRDTNGSLAGSPQSVTIPAGQSDASFTYYDENAGSQTITAADSADGFDSVNQVETVTPGALNHFSVVGPSSTIAGDPLSVTVTAFDSFGNVKTDYAGTVQFASSDSGSQTVSPADYAFTTGEGGDNGAHTFTDGVTLTKTPSQTVSVNDAADSSKTGVSDPIAVDPGPVDHFVWSKEPAGSRVAGMSWGLDAAEVTAYDAYGNVDATGPNQYSGANLTLDGLGTSPSPVLKPPHYETVEWSGGVGTVSGVIDYKAEMGSLTVRDTVAGVGPAVSDPVIVNPAPVDHFEFGLPSPSPVVAGVQSTVQVHAYDLYENLSTNSLGTPSLSTNLEGSNVGCSGSCTVSQSLSAFSTDGSAAATIPFTAYRAEGGRTLTVTAGGGGDGASSTSDPFAVTPAPVDHFEYGPLSPANVVAGVPSTLSVSAFDRYENASSNDLTPVSLSNTMHQSSQGCSGPCTPNVNVSTPFDASGVGAVTLTGYKAETGRMVTVTAHDGNGTPSSTFDVLAGMPASVTFTRTPTEVQALSGSTCAPDPNACFINFYRSPQGVQAQAFDTWGNVANNQTTFHSQIAITESNGPGVLAGGDAVNTDSNGTVTFTTLTINAVGIGDTIRATASPAAANSNPVVDSNKFDVANALQLCSHSCNGSATEPTLLSDSVSVSSSGQTDTLGIALASLTPPATACSGWHAATLANGQPVDGSYVDVTSNGAASLPSFHITWELLKPLVTLQPDNGAAHYNICLGAVWIGNPLSLRPWITKSGAPAVGFPDLDQNGNGVTRYWGLLPDCKPGKGLTSTNPCIVSRTKSGGNVIIVFNVPAGWDPNHNGGI